MARRKYVHFSELHNLQSPGIIVPVIYDVLKPASVVDVGCGLGTFLHTFKQCGTKEVMGLDGPWINKEKLSQYLDADSFKIVNLHEPIRLDKKYDLAICLEVAEHIASKSADTIVESLVSLSNTVLFSAAIPFQGGQNHLNEQYIDYWKEKFAKHDYITYDVLRLIFWNNKEVFWWYKQNMFLIAHKDVKVDVDAFRKKEQDPHSMIFIHPELYEERMTRLKKIVSGKASWEDLFKVTGNFIRHKLGMKK
ncbi:MAG: methyltransferase domain-containing protein [Chitinophagaceae bacterium]